MSNFWEGVGATIVIGFVVLMICAGFYGLGQRIGNGEGRLAVQQEAVELGYGSFIYGDVIGNDSEGPRIQTFVWDKSDK